MKKIIQTQIKKIIKKYHLNCLIKDFTNIVNEVDWVILSRHETLSEDFIREFQDYVNWDIISFYQDMSKDFCKEFQDKINWTHREVSQKLLDILND
jgi:hypothetical protein